MTGLVLGVPGGSLSAASWAANDAVARIGQGGERKTAAVLDMFASGPWGATILHDLSIPSRKYTGNIDHVVVSGREVVIVDSKVWQPGFYYTLGGVTRCALRRAPHVDKRTMVVAHRALAGYLAGYGANVRKPLVAVWPSSGRRQPRLWAADMPGARLIRADRLDHTLRQMLAKHCAADPAIVTALVALMPRR